MTVEHLDRALHCSTAAAAAAGAATRISTGIVIAIVAFIVVVVVVVFGGGKTFAAARGGVVIVGRSRLAVLLGIASALHVADERTVLAAEKVLVVGEVAVTVVAVGHETRVDRDLLAQKCVLKLEALYTLIALYRREQSSKRIYIPKSMSELLLSRFESILTAKS